MSRSINFLAMLVLLITASALAVADVSCANVTKAAAPCLDFVKGNSSGDRPSAACCAGAQDLGNQAKSKKDKQAMCDCLKEVLSKIGPYQPSRVPLIPQKCGVKISLPPIGDNTDCSKV